MDSQKFISLADNHVWKKGLKCRYNADIHLIIFFAIKSFWFQQRESNKINLFCYLKITSKTRYFYLSHVFSIPTLRFFLSIYLHDGILVGIRNKKKKKRNWRESKKKAKKFDLRSFYVIYFILFAKRMKRIKGRK